MLSIRRVTVKPPKTLMLASRMATPAITWTAGFSIGACRIAPTTMIPLMALVTLMSGVCNAWWTLPMT
ncbi:hypothetical protein SAMN04489844_1309 [Nocardioides exalbidus]|uniref:Uncharacterized protein n=1 Tax=Nocardioides exalbidus TaxID=402596 RepID=A0A1H4N6M7_9ACTN|nr:hypothetical protein SAMN04489844_1309 [Nocardioides exalbidus]